MRRVCRLWNQVAKLLDPSKGLFVCPVHHAREQRRWISNNRPIEPNQVIDQTTFDRFLMNGLASKTKRIYFFHFKSSELECYEIESSKGKAMKKKLRECLDNLEELVIEDSSEDSSDLRSSLTHLYFLGDYTDKVFHLTKVKWLCLDWDSYGSFTLDCPQMKKLVCLGRIQKLDLKSSVDTLEYLEYDNIPRNLLEKAAPNLKHLVCLESPVRFDLNDFPSLVKLDLCPSKSDEEWLQLLLRQKQEFARDALEITFCGFKNVQVFCMKGRNSLFKPFREFSPEKLLLLFHEEQIDKFVEKPSNFTRNFRCEVILMLAPRLFNHPNLSDYLSALNCLNVQHVALWFQLNGCDEQMICFLSSLKKLNFLTFFHCYFRKESYEKLMPLLGSIQMLDITNYSFERSIRNRDNHCYEFLLDLKLRKFRLANSFLPLNTIRKAIEQGLGEFLFKCPSASIKINTKSSSYSVCAGTGGSRLASLEETFSFIQENEITKQILK